jgi:hypothetical protein
MILRFFSDARIAAEAGSSLADQIAVRLKPDSIDKRVKRRAAAKAWRGISRHVVRETQAPRLNFFGRAKFSNAFKWRLIELGVEKTVADQVTHSLVLHLCAKPACSSNSQIGAPPKKASLGLRQA